MDSLQRQRGNESHIHHRHRHVSGCHSAKMSFEDHGNSGYNSNVQAHRRPQSNHQSKVFQHHPHKVCIMGTMSQCTASTASLSDSEFGGDSTDVRRRRVQLAGEGESLELISYTSASLLEDEYWRLNSNVSMNDDKSSCTGSTRMSTPTYYRPIDSFEERISSINSVSSSSSSSHLHPRAVSARTTCSHSDEVSAVTFNYSCSEDGLLTSRLTHQHTKPTMSPQRKIKKTMCWTEDDSELRRMESITHSFQRSSSTTSRNHKISAPTLPGIGVDICRSASYQQDHIPTPREAASVLCTLSSIMGELLGVAQQRGGANSSINGLLSGFFCGSHHAHNTDRRSSKYDADDWSVNANSHAEKSRCSFDDDDESECIRGEDVRNVVHVDGHRNRPPRSTKSRRGSSRIDEPAAGTSRRQRTARDDKRIELHRNVQDSPHVRRLTNRK